MANFLVLERAYIAIQPGVVETLEPGRVISDTQFDIPFIQAQGAALVEYDPGTMDGPIAAFRRQAGKPGLEGDLTALLIAAGAIGGGGGAVASVFGRSGAVVAQAGDYTVTQVTGAVELAGQLGGTTASPDVRGVRETSGPSLLTIGAIADRELLLRSGSALVGTPMTRPNRGFRGFTTTDYYEVANVDAGGLVGNASPGFELMTAAIVDQIEGGGFGTRELVSAIPQFTGPGYSLLIDDLRAQFALTNGGGARFGLNVGNWARSNQAKLLVVLNVQLDGSDFAFYVNGIEFRSGAFVGYSPATTPVRMGLNAGAAANAAVGLTHLGFGFKSDGPMTASERETAFRDLIVNGHFQPGVFTNLYTAEGLELGAAPAVLEDLIGTVDLSLVGSLTVADDRAAGFSAYQVPAPDDAVVRVGGLLSAGSQFVSVAGPTPVLAPRVACDSSVATIGLTCPGAPDLGTEFSVLDTGRNAATNNITITRSGLQLINGATTFVLTTDGQAVTLYFDGINWLAY